MGLDIETRLERVENTIYGSLPLGDSRKTSFTLRACYISSISPDGSRVTVTPLDDSNVSYEATQLSPIPTSVLDGRRLQGIPTVKGGPGSEFGASTVICAIIDHRYYILGYFNLPTADLGEKVSLVKKFENIKPLRGGILLKLSKIGSIVARKSNWLKVNLGSWANIDAKGECYEDAEREPIYTIKWANIVQKTWGGVESWLRTNNSKLKGDQYTTYTSVQGRFHEPLGISDSNLDIKERNDGIDEVNSAPGSEIPPKNPDDLGYIDKVITKIGQIGDDTHVFEREVRQSKEVDKEKTVFTRLREGNREGVLREFETEDVLEFTKTSEKRGAGIGDNTRIMSNDFIHTDGADEPVIQEQLLEEFGQGPDDMYRKYVLDANGDYVEHIKNADGNFVTIGNTTDEVVVYKKSIANDGAIDLQVSKDNAAIYKMTVANDGKATLVVGEDKIIIESDPSTGFHTITATEQVIVNSPKILLGDGASEALVLGDAFKSYFDTHIHATGVGPSAPPTAPMPPTTLSTKNTTQ